MSTRPWLDHYPDGVRSQGIDYPQVPLFTLLDRTAAEHGEKTATYFYGRTLTYRQLAGAANQFANALISIGIKKGDRVMLMAPNSPQFVIAFFGILKAGGIVAQTNPLYVEDEIKYQANNSGARAAVVADLLYPRMAKVREQTGLEEIFVFKLAGNPLDDKAASFEAALESQPATDPGIAVDWEDVAVLQYTGGTTGVSKGAMLTHKNLVANAVQVSEWFGPLALAPGEERALTVLPLFHSYGMTCCMNLSVLNASEMILLPKFDLKEVMETIKATKPTAFPGVPTMYVAVNSFPGAEEYGVGSIRTCNSGGAAMPMQVMNQFESRFGATIAEGYGLSEASPVTHCNPLQGTRKTGSIGLAYPDTDCRIVDLASGTKEVPLGQEGELIIRGPQVMKGYWNMPEETAHTLREFEGETWLYTGDIARMDEDGYFYITDRKKDMIIAGGFNIYPRDVEEVIYKHPAVQEAVVAGVPDAYRGETVKAYVVAKAGQSVTAEELNTFCRAHLAAFKVPHQYEFRSELPKSAAGKILRRVLIDQEKAKLKNQE